MFFKKAKRIQALEVRVAELQHSITKEYKRVLAEKEKAVKIEVNARKIAGERDELKSKIREQTEADLLKVSLDIVLSVYGIKKDVLKDNLVKQQAMYQQQLSALRGGYNTHPLQEIQPDVSGLLGMLGR